MLAEDAYEQPTGFHYLFRRGGDSAPEREGAEQHLAAQGCTKVMHYAAPDDTGGHVYASFGYVEPIAVVRQRAQEPQYG